MSSSDFSSLGIAPAILRSLKELGYETPSPIQQQSIPVLIEGANLLGTAQTGTGKTAAFALPLLSRLDAEQRAPQVLVLTPTRELGIQVAEAFKRYARYVDNFSVTAIYGGAAFYPQLQALKRGVQVVVGTPGRILDHMRRNSLDLSQIRAVVLDEADEMLRMGFIDDVESILGATPDHAQRALFSATMPKEIRRVVERYIGDAQKVEIESKTATVERIRQRYLFLNNNQKLDALTRLMEVENFDGMIVFVRTKQATIEVAEKLEARGFAAAAINGDLSQQLREQTIAKIKKGVIDILVATDVAARGLDVERITHVINYDIPYDAEAYVHRIGRTGRAGRDGTAILFVSPRESRLLKSIERTTRQPLEKLRLPTSGEVSGQRIADFQQQILDTLESQDLDEFRGLLEQLATGHDVPMVDLAAALAFQAQLARPLFPNMQEMSLPEERGKDWKMDGDRPAKGRKGKKEFGDKKGHGERKERADRPAKREYGEKGKFEGSDRPARTERGDKPRKSGRDMFIPDQMMVTYRLGVGKNHGVFPKDIVGAIANEAGIESQYIGRISIEDNSSTVDLPDGMPKEIFRHLQKVRIKQQPINITVDKSGSERSNKPRKAKQK